MIGNDINRLDDLDGFVSHFLFMQSKGCQPAIRNFLGVEKFAEFIQKFAGCTFKMPHAAKLALFVDRYRLAEKYRLYKLAFKEGRLGDGRVLEADFRRIAKSLRLPGDKAIRAAQETLKSITAAKRWEADYNEAVAKSAARLDRQLGDEIEFPAPEIMRPANHAGRQQVKARE